MTIDEAIKRFQSNAEYERTHGSLQGCLELRQLVEWLRKYQKIQEIVKEWREVGLEYDSCDAMMNIEKVLQEPTTKIDKVDCEHTDCNNCVNHKYCDYEPTPKNDLGVDCISRQATINAVKRIHPVDTDYDCTLYDKVDVMYVLDEMPSVTPQEPRWIPVSEYLPVTNDEVLVTYIVNGNAKKRYVETANCFDGEWSSVNDEYRIPNTKIEIIAWCEMPKPYKA